ncbi:hypothetical protein GF374_01895 [Candidatus Woesearchaeota archaeon]|nr:hypothetical protein [Candidatus Woesearchaeota archaeon]
MNLKKAFEVKGYNQLEIYHGKSKSRNIIIKNNKIKNFESNLLVGTGIRAIVKGKIGFAYTTNSKKLIETVKKAIKLAKYSNQKVKLKSYSKYSKPKGLFDKKIPEINNKELIDSAEKAISFAKKNKAILTQSGLGLSESSITYLNSEGLDLHEKTTYFSNSSSVNYKGVEADWEKSSRNYDDVLLSITKKAMNIAKQMSKKGKIKTDKYDVVFHPLALQQILKNGLYTAFNSDFIQKGKSMLADKIGKKIFDEKLTIIDNGILDKGLNSGVFDGDGVPMQKTTLVKNGVVKGFLYDLLRAQKENKKSTGNAMRGYISLPSVYVSNFQIKPGKVKDVVSEIDKGLLLYSPLNAHSINPITGNFSLGAMMALWIEKGEVKFAPKNVMLSGNVFDLLNNINMIGSNSMQISESLASPSIVAKTQVIGD